MRFLLFFRIGGLRVALLIAHDPPPREIELAFDPVVCSSEILKWGGDDDLDECAAQDSSRVVVVLSYNNSNSGYFSERKKKERVFPDAGSGENPYRAASSNQ